MMNASKIKRTVSVAGVCILMATGCSEPKVPPGETDITVKTKLPYFGQHDVELVHKSDGTAIPDTAYYTIPKFSFIGENGQELSHRDYEGKIFVADFFFTTCKSICPAMSSQMARLQSLIKKAGIDKEVMFLSHSVKPDEDTPEVLRNYGLSIGADFSNWHFATGNAEDIYDLAEEGYMLNAFPSDTAEGGIFHTDKFTLVDRHMHIRGYYDGTSTKSVDQLFNDIQILIQQENAEHTTQH